MSRDSSSGPLVITRVESRDAGNVAFITVNNPERRNALGIEGKKQLEAAFRNLARDKALRVAVLTGAGERSFIAGADIKEMGRVPARSWTSRSR